MNQKEYLFSKAYEFEKEGKFLHSVQLYQNLIEDADFGKLAVIRLATVYDKMEKTNSAISILEKYMVEIAGSDDEIRLLCSELMIKIGMYSQAIQNISQLTGEIRPELYFLLGIANYGLNDLNIAKINFSEFIRLTESSEYTIEAYSYLANISLNQNELNEAIQYIEKAKELGQDNYEVWFTAAKIYYYKEMFFHANDSIKKAIKIKNNDTKLLFWAAKINYQMGEYKEAENILIPLFNSDAKDAEISAYLGMVNIKLNKIDVALRYFETSLNIDPLNQIAIQNKQKIENRLKVGN
ncbi:MAG: CDC27 family protein [bacterium]